MSLALALAISIAAMAGPLAVLFAYTLVRPRKVVAFFGRGRGADLDNALNGLRLAMAVALFSVAFLAGALTAFMSRFSAL